MLCLTNEQKKEGRRRKKEVRGGREGEVWEREEGREEEIKERRKVIVSISVLPPNVLHD